MPDFGRPPLVETVLSVQFEPLGELHTAHFGLFWSEVFDRFPETEERGELPQLIERFPDVPKPTIGIQLEAFEAPPTPRFLFGNLAGTELIQLQRDRFIKNWRKTGHGEQYPRYEKVKAGFEKDFSLFDSFVRKHGLGEIRINQCEVTYVNQIVAGAGWTGHAEVGRVFKVWSQPTDEPPGAADDLSFQARFTIRDETNSAVGRLHATMQSTMRNTDNKLVFVLSLTARGQTGEGTGFFDVGREAIVKSFKSLTTPEMHEIWDLKE